eukprot:g36190.t1
MPMPGPVLNDTYPTTRSSRLRCCPDDARNPGSGHSTLPPVQPLPTNARSPHSGLTATRSPWLRYQTRPLPQSRQESCSRYPPPRCRIAGPSMMVG